MAIVVMWDNRDHTVVRLEFETEWSFAELEGAIQETDSFIASVEHDVDIIIDIEGSQIPKDFMTLARSLLANPEPRPNEGNRVIIGATSFVRKGYSAIKKTFGEKLTGRELFFAEDLMDARVMLRGLRQ